MDLTDDVVTELLASTNVDLEQWKDFILYRRTESKGAKIDAFGPVAQKRLLIGLSKHYEAGYDPCAMLDNTMTNGAGWQGVFRKDDFKRDVRRQRETTVTVLAEVKVDKVLGAAAFAEMKERAKKGN